MDERETVEVGRLGGLGAREVAWGVREVHLGISAVVKRHVDRQTGGLSAPVTATERALTTGIYAVTGFALQHGGHLLGHGLARRRRGHPSVHDGPVGADLLAFYNGLHGHLLEEQDSPLALLMTLRKDGRAVVPDRESLAAAYGPEVSGTLAVLVHGFVESERVWSRERPGAMPGARGSTYAEVLRDGLGTTPVFVRYNSGRGIRNSGAQLAGLLTALVGQWPVPVTRVVVIGHSMGGLVIDVALDEMRDDDGVLRGWAGMVTDFVALGTPWAGHEAERVVARVTPRLREGVAGARWTGRVLQTRGPGVKDLGAGATWLRDGSRPDAGACGPRRVSVVSRLVGDAFPARPANGLGDGVVSIASASADPLCDERVLLRGINHLALANHPDVEVVLLRVLSAPGSTRVEEPRP